MRSRWSCVKSNIPLYFPRQHFWVILRQRVWWVWCSFQQQNNIRFLLNLNGVKETCSNVQKQKNIDKGKLGGAGVASYGQVAGIIIARKGLKVMQLQTYPQNSNILLQQRGVIKKIINLSNSTLEIKGSQVDLQIVGGRNKITIDESAGKVIFKGNENQIEIRKSWLACAIEGSQNIFNLVQTEFLLTSHNGEANIIPGVLGDHHIPIRRRMMHDRIMNMRIALKQRSEHVKKLLPHLLKSSYNSVTRECSICYDDIKQGDEVTSLFCFHFFHSTCIEACLETAVKCPVCSLDLLKVINDEIRIGNFRSVNGDLVMKESLEVEQQ